MPTIKLLSSSVDSSWLGLGSASSTLSNIVSQVVGDTKTTVKVFLLLDCVLLVAVESFPDFFQQSLLIKSLVILSLLFIAAFYIHNTPVTLTRAKTAVKELQHVLTKWAPGPLNAISCILILSWVLYCCPGLLYALFCAGITWIVSLEDISEQQTPTYTSSFVTSSGLTSIRAELERLTSELYKQRLLQCEMENRMDESVGQLCNLIRNNEMEIRQVQLRLETPQKSVTWRDYAASYIKMILKTYILTESQVNILRQIRGYYHRVADYI